MRVYGLWSRLVDPYSEPELIELFILPADAEAAKAGLIGKRTNPRVHSSAWSDDEDFPDLYVKAIEVR